MAAILKLVKRDISAAVWSILTKFGMSIHISPRNLILSKNLKK